MKYYAVKVGRNPGVYTSWDECKLQTDGFSGAVYKSFLNENDAVGFIKGENKVTSECEAFAYTDGSFNIETSCYSYGVVFFHGEEKLTFSEKFSNPENASMRNVAGEIAGAMKAMSYCIENKIKSLEIIYDYEGVEKWCTGEWKTNKSGTIEYKRFYDKVTPMLNVKFTKVKGHSGNKYNDEADKLAKEAVGIRPGGK